MLAERSNLRGRGFDCESNDGDDGGSSFTTILGFSPLRDVSAMNPDYPTTILRRPTYVGDVRLPSEPFFRSGDSCDADDILDAGASGGRCCFGLGSRLTWFETKDGAVAGATAVDIVAL